MYKYVDVDIWYKIKFQKHILSVQGTLSIYKFSISKFSSFTIGDLINCDFFPISLADLQWEMSGVKPAQLRCTDKIEAKSILIDNLGLF